MKDTSTIGDIGEVAFDLKCMQLGFIVSRPLNRSSPYDHVVDNHQSLLRVQTKTGTQRRETKDKGPAYFININHSQGHSIKTFYCPGAFDYWALHVPEFEAWWIMPLGVFAGHTGTTMHPDSMGDRFREYRDAWHLLDATRENANGQAIRTPLFMLGGERLHERPNRDAYDTAPAADVPSFVPSGNVLLDTSLAA